MRALGPVQKTRLWRGAAALVLMVAGTIAWYAVPGYFLNPIATRYGITIQWQGEQFPVTVPPKGSEPGGSLTGYDASPFGVLRFHGPLAEELALYPVDFIHKAGLKGIVLSKFLGIDVVSSSVGSMEVDDQIYLDLSGIYPVETRRFDIHSELFHLIEDRVHIPDSDWDRLNPYGFRYRRAGIRGRRLVRPDYGMPGFMDASSRYDEREDRAALYAFMITQPTLVNERATADPYLRAKVRYIIQVVRRFWPSEQGQFWERLRQAVPTYSAAGIGR